MYTFKFIVLWSVLLLHKLHSSCDFFLWKLSWTGTADQLPRYLWTRGGWLRNTVAKLSRSVHEKCWGAVFRVRWCASQSMGWRRRFFKVLSQFPTSHMTWSQPSISFFSPLSLCFWIVNPTSTSTGIISHIHTDDHWWQFHTIWCSWSTRSVSYRLIGLCENIFVENLCLVDEEVM